MTPEEAFVEAEAPVCQYMYEDGRVCRDVAGLWCAMCDEKLCIGHAIGRSSLMDGMSEFLCAGCAAISEPFYRTLRVYADDLCRRQRVACLAGKKDAKHTACARPM